MKFDVGPYYQHDNVTIFCGPFQSIPRRDGFADTIATDPPYPREYSYLWRDLARFSRDALVRGGSVLSIVPHYLLPEVLGMMNVPPLKYRWTMAMWQHGGAHPRMAMGIEVTWKPVVWWVKGAWPQGRGFRIDGFKNRQYPADKKRPKLHKWEQSMDWAEYCLKFVPEGGTVVDPMMGSGPMVVAARDKNIKVIGVDIDEEACATTVARLEGRLS